MSRILDAMHGDAPFAYPRAPGYREQTTSRAAARVVAAGAGALRERVFAVIRAAGARGLTADEAAAALGETILCIRPRVSELRAEGRIEPTGERRKNDSGLSAKAWRAA